MLTYTSALSRLLQAVSTPKLGLERMKELLFLLGNPHHNLKLLHVAGTNGKGSTCAFLHRALWLNGYRTGLYTSPHLLCARERIQINEELISEESFAQLEEKIHQVTYKMSSLPTFFESMTAMGFLYFQEQSVDVAVIEVGLGGKYDATNIISPIVCGITSIDKDHTQFLGPTVIHIAKEKAGIMKPGVPVVIGKQTPEVVKVLEDSAQSAGALLVKATFENYSLSLHGHHQQDNAQIAHEMLIQSRLNIDPLCVKEAFSSTSWPCRYEYVQHHPSVILDGAHNPAGFEQLLSNLSIDTRVKDLPKIMMLGMTSGHDPHEIAEIIKNQPLSIHSFYFLSSRSPRAVACEEIAKAFSSSYEPLSFEDTLEKALLAASRLGACVIITGSLYVAGEARKRWKKMPIDAELPSY